jgi:hypothetical protein
MAAFGKGAGNFITEQGKNKGDNGHCRLYVEPKFGVVGVRPRAPTHHSNQE